MITSFSLVWRSISGCIRFQSSVKVTGRGGGDGGDGDARVVSEVSGVSTC